MNIKHQSNVVTSLNIIVVFNTEKGRCPSVQRSVVHVSVHPKRQGPVKFKAHNLKGQFTQA